MNPQMTLGFLGTMDTVVSSPVARRSDPATSQKAAAEVTGSGKLEGQYLAVYALVAKYPGCTSFELSQKPGCSLDRWTIAKRLRPLARAGHIKEAKSRPCSVTGKEAMTWRTA